MLFKKLLLITLAGLPFYGLHAGSNPQKNIDPLLKTFIYDTHRINDQKLQESLANSYEWQNFLSRHPGWWVTFNVENRKPHRATGAAIQPAVGGSPEQVAAYFLHNELKEFRLPESDMVLRNVAENRKFYYVHYKQNYQGLEVLWANAIIKMNKNKEIILFGLDVYDDIKISTMPAISVAAAETFARAQVDGVTSVTHNGLKVLPVPTAAKVNNYHLVYEVIVKNKDADQIPAEYYTLVDAVNGEILYRQNKVMHMANTDVNINGTVYPNHPYLPQSVVNLGYVGVTVGTTGYFTDSSGYLGLSNTSPVSATISLEGQWSDTRTGNTTPSFTVTLNPGANNLSFDNDANIRELCAFNNVNRIHDYYKLVTNGSSAQNTMDFTMLTFVDEAGSCNAFYNGDVNFYEQAGGCHATALINDVVYHEYGHGINYEIYNHYGGNFNNGAMGEGYADTWANGLTEDPVLGIGFYDNNPLGYVRRYDINRKVYPQDLIGEVHADGEIIAGCWWDVALNFGSVQDRQDLFFLTQAATISGPTGSEGQIFTDVLIEALTDDDNDGNINNGTPRYCEIVNAFGLHGITTGGTSAVVSLTHVEPNSVPASAPVVINTTIPTAALPAGSIVNAYYKTTFSTPAVYTPVPMVNTSGNNWTATLPGFQAGTIVYYYFDIVKTDSCGSGQLLEKPFLTSASNPNVPYNLLVGYTMLEHEDFENWQAQWTFGLPDDSATTGMWTYDTPVASLLDQGNPNSYVQPGFQNTPGGNACALTGNAQPTEGAGAQDVDNGETTLISSAYDLAEAIDPALTYYRFYSNDQGATPGTDYWQVAISNNNGATWVPIENTNVADHSFRRVAIKVKDYVTLSNQVVLRFIAEDANDGSLIEGLVDDVTLWDAVPSGFNEKSNLFHVKVFPNPAKNVVHINCVSNSQEPVEIMLHDMLGNLVYQTLDNGPQHQLNTASFHDGVYMLIVKQGEMRKINRVTVVK